jgi:hypothetical protein
MHHSGLTDIDDAHPAIHPPIAHRYHPLSFSFSLILASLTIRRTRHHLHRAPGLFKLDNRFERLVVAARKRRKVHRERMASAQIDVHLESLRWRSVHRSEEGVGRVYELRRRN